MADETEHASAARGDEDSESTEVSFVGFILSLAHTAAMHLGDVADPATGTTGEIQLPAAQQMIDLLALLELKTRGNLSIEERQLLEQILFELRMRFVEIAKTGPAGPEPSRIIIP